MAIEIKVENKETHLTIKCKGNWDPIAVSNVLKQFKMESEKYSQTKLFIDWRDVSAPPMDWHRFRAGLEISQILTAPIKIAVLANKENITHFAETTARNRGAMILVMDNETKALNWLLNPNSNY